jgi:uncharacterized protein with PIN domain
MKIFKKDYYEQLFGKKTETVAEYYADIARAQKRILELQSKCNHLTYDVAFYMWRPGAMEPSHICKTCNAVIGSATQEESEKLWQEFKGEMEKPLSTFVTNTNVLKG